MGSQSNLETGSCQKKQIFNLICEKLMKAGWVNVALNPCSDCYIFASPDIQENNGSGDKDKKKKLIIQLRDTNAKNEKSVVSTNFCLMSYRLQDSYEVIENTLKLGRSELPWTELPIAPVPANQEILMDIMVEYKVHTDARKIILALEYPIGSGLKPMLIYIGRPDTTYVTETESRGILVGVTCNAIVAGSVHISNYPDKLGSSREPYSLPTMALIPATGYNSAEEYFISDIYYGSAAVGGATRQTGTSEGIRGKLDGIYCMLDKDVLTGDNILINDKTYYVLSCQIQGNSSFPSQALLLEL